MYATMTAHQEPLEDAQASEIGDDETRLCHGRGAHAHEHDRRSVTRRSAAVDTGRWTVYGHDVLLSMKLVAVALDVAWPLIHACVLD